MEKRKPGYQLSHIKAAFGDSARLNRTFSSKQGAVDLGMDDEAVVALIPGFEAFGFRKVDDFNRRSQGLAGCLQANDRRWRIVYVKFTLDEQKELLLISFKEA